MRATRYQWSDLVREVLTGIILIAAVLLILKGIMG